MNRTTFPILLRITVIMLAVFTVTACAALRPAPDDSEHARDSPPKTTAEQQRWHRLASGNQSAVRVPLTLAITSRELWSDFWAALTANQLAAPEPPSVDFQEETVIVLLLGERRTGGFSVRIDEVVTTGDYVRVVVDVTRPRPGEMVTQALTSPYYIASIPVTGKEVLFSGDDVERGFEGD